MTYSQTWNLESIYPGGINSPELMAKYDLVAEQIHLFAEAVDKAEASAETIANLSDLAQTIGSGLGTINIFINGWASVDYGNSIYSPHFDKLGKLFVDFSAPLNKFQKLLLTLDDASFERVIHSERLTDIAFYLSELRTNAKRLLDDDTESLINQLDLDGQQAWSKHYDTISASLSMNYTDNEDGKTRHISAGQALNMLDGEANNDTRANIMANYEKMWSNAENLTADTLNHLAGFRLTNQKAHNQKNHLEQPLEMNRMSQATLDAMWRVVDDNKSMFKPYFDRKKQLLGLKNIGWQDQVAPLTNIGDYQPEEVSYDDAAAFIIEQFGKFSPKMASFAKMAFEKRWIESENRPGKQPGGYMESVPDLQESRIFLTYTGSVNDAATIAHELGHAFHSAQLTDLPLWRDAYAMNVAETASTFAELIVNDANVRGAKSDAEKLVLLDAKMTNPIAMFLNIHARFLFEDAFYQERKNGVVTPQRLNELMDDAQKNAFDGILDVRHPHFWSSKLHFFIDSVPFYNFPYTFGYLFSAGIYAQAQKDDADFEDKYIALLRDTANMTSEELAKKHLGVDLTQPDFWQAGANLIQKDIDEFLTLSEQFI
ncbi:M3 family oligoendopeptidase [Leuconostoc carnosum]|uniref:M3 family oligoendopeptidase n=1 Tax=Leuconostoc carnosum TaxID=1252 RepID=UPI00123B1F7D|nr:M3 family oligoendopeptidase [Leuconostoc carnosum]KAA8369760.1 M3 family oligoendopeptidase [Leuconostoc carnosum]KAA8380751.1 M3 family oligoendopeptidase [Leuconostoc carnosum]